MRIRCPHCQQRVEVLEDDPLVEVDCPSCNSSFSLVGGSGESTEAWETRTIGHFELLNELGRGAFGSVWKAHDSELDRFVAVKLPRKEQLTDGESEQFLREARAAAQMKHPNLVGVHEVGRDEGGQLYIVSDFVQGASLAEWLQSKTPNIEEVVELMIRLCEAVQYAHSQGVIHRDLKPQNILMDAEGVPYITDFGLAKREAGEITMTIDGKILGTPAYMSPEQASGKSHTVDARSDVYSLGVILFELLTGELPFRGSPQMLIIQILKDEAPSPRKLNNRIPRVFETICLKCLRKEASRRYESAQQVADDLRRALENKPIMARPVSRIEKAWLWCRRRPAVAGLIVGILLVTAAATTIVIAQKQISARNRAEVAVESVLGAHPQGVPYAIQVVEPLRDHALPILRRHFDDVSVTPTRRLHAAVALAAFGEGEPEFLVASIAGASGDECENIAQALNSAPEVAIALLRQEAEQADTSGNWEFKARLAIVALHLGDTSIASDVHRIENRPDPTQQTVFIHDVFPIWHGNLKFIAEVLEQTDDGALRAGMSLAAGNLNQLSDDEKRIWQQLLSMWNRQSPDSGTHGATGWALRQWKVALPEIAPSTTDANGRDWIVSPQGLSMIKVPAGQFEQTQWIGLPQPRRVKRTVTLTHDFWLSETEVSLGLFRQFIDDEEYKGLKPSDWPGVDYQGAARQLGPTNQHPAVWVNWEDAVQFCNWLSWKERRKPWYEIEPIPDVKRGDSETLKVELAKDGTGYRLPTDAEWEYACRAGTATDFCFGSGAERLKQYAVFSAETTETTASKLCNRWGLFDMQGNVSEWCSDRTGFVLRPGSAPTRPHRIVRGGDWYTSNATSCYSWLQRAGAPRLRIATRGLRVAQGPLLETGH